MKPMIFNDYPDGFEKVWDTGERKKFSNCEYIFHRVQRKFLWFKYYSWINRKYLEEEQQVEYWKEEV